MQLASAGQSHWYALDLLAVHTKPVPFPRGNPLSTIVETSFESTTSFELATSFDELASSEPASSTGSELPQEQTNKRRVTTRMGA